MTDIFQATHDLRACLADSQARLVFQLLPSFNTLNLCHDKRGDDNQLVLRAGDHGDCGGWIYANGSVHKIPAHATDTVH